MWGRPAPPPSPTPPPDLIHQPTLYLHREATALVPLAERLEQAGIPVTIQRLTNEKGGEYFALHVRADDEERARREVAPLVDEGLDPGLRQTLDRDFDPEKGYRRCPACRSDLPASAGECPVCGLVLSGEPEA